MTRSECEARCREILREYEGRYFSRFPENHCIEFALPDMPKKRKRVVMVDLLEKPNEAGVIGGVDFDEERLSPFCGEWSLWGIGTPCETYEGVLSTLRKRLEENKCVKKKKDVQMTLFDFM